MRPEHEARGERAESDEQRPPNRPLRAISTLILALAAAVGVYLEGVPLRITNAQQLAEARLYPPFSIGIGHVITIGGTAIFFVLALISTFAWARWARSVLERFIGIGYGDIVRYVMILLGICVVILVSLSMLGFRVAQLVVGGAVTGVLITIAAQQSLSNLFAGVMLQFAHPFKVGDQVRIKAGALGGAIDGTVTEFSITYVKMATDEGLVYLPNSEVLAAAVTPLRTAPPAEPAPPGQAVGVPGPQGMAALAEGMAALAQDLAAVAQSPAVGPDHAAATPDHADKPASPPGDGGSASGEGSAPVQD
ncbi:MAG TPA: mechanosensitive ion channel family protein [Streptosporangiaceae bacterium]|nr:mechanosensitive ion channel family protein [Streptosporangiaceae bacterium]